MRWYCYASCAGIPNPNPNPNRNPKPKLKPTHRNRTLTSHPTTLSLARWQKEGGDGDEAQESLRGDEEENKSPYR